MWQGHLHLVGQAGPGHMGENFDVEGGEESSHAMMAWS
jgi:hypothetical protein